MADLRPIIAPMIFGTLLIVSLYIAVVVLIYSLHICPLKALSRGLWTRLLLALFPSIKFDHTQIGYNSAVCSRFSSLLIHPNILRDDQTYETHSPTYTKRTNATTVPCRLQEHAF